jgi:protein SMG6
MKAESSISSSAITLSSTTDGSSASSALFDRRPNQEQASNSIFSVQLKKLYVVLKGKEVENEDLEKEKWKKQISDHKMLVMSSILGVFAVI